MSRVFTRLLDATIFKVLDYYVVHHFVPLMRERFLQDFRTQQHLSATWSTAHYIVDKMKNARPMDTRETLLDLAIEEANILGCYLEFGVFEGYSLNYIAGRTQEIVHGFDSFEGLPDSWNVDNPKGTFRKGVGWRPQVAQNVMLHPGWFDETLPRFLKDHPEDVSFLHIDCDLYASTKPVFDGLCNRIKEGTVIVFDEYFAYPGWEHHEFAAFHEFIRDRGLDYRYLAYRRNGSEVALKITAVVEARDDSQQLR